MTSPPTAAAIGTELHEQWSEIDGVLQSLAQRSRARRGSDEDETDQPAPRAAPPSHHSERARRPRLADVMRECDKLRARLAAADRELRSARARLERVERPRHQVAAGGRWLRVVQNHLRRSHSD